MNGFILTLASCYAALSMLTWLVWRPRSTETYPIRKELLVLFPIWVAHAALILFPIFRDQVLSISFGYALSLVSWLMVTLYGMSSLRLPLMGMQLLLYPLTALSLFLFALLPDHTAHFPLNTIGFMLHVTSALFAYTLFAIAALLAISILLSIHMLRRKKITPFSLLTPPLLSTEQLMFKSINIGFILLSIAIISGLLSSETLFHDPLRITHKTVFTIISWFIYLFVILKHHKDHWRGKFAAYWVLAAFVSLMLAYFGSKFVLVFILHRLY